MVLVDQFRVSDDGKSLFIDVHVNRAAYFTDVYLSKITLCTEEQVHETSPKSFTDYVYQTNIEGKEAHLVLNAAMLNEKFTHTDFSQNLFFVFVECTGTPASDTPCSLDEMVTVGVTFDYGLVFNKAMNYTKELADTCSIPRQFIDFILNENAFRLAVETEHYVPAIKYWKQMVDDTKGACTTIKKCGCHG